MIALLNDLSNMVLSKNWNDCTEQDLNILSAAQPYSSVAQLLYAQKLKQNNSEAYRQQWQKTMLYFNDPLLLQYLFNSNKKNMQENVQEATAAHEHIHGSVVTSKTSLQQLNEVEAMAAPPTEKIFTHNLVEEETVEIIDFDDDAADDLPPIEDQPELKLPEFKIEMLDPDKAALSFTPYHTVDYFASQGIKVKNDLGTSTKFGEQLKSFTDWLKEMRRLPEAAVTANFSIREQASVESLAEKSIEGENALTDSMAQVWAKQGNYKKAIEVYQKLSLQNPSKRSYFAAKIEHLKKIS